MAIEDNGNRVLLLYPDADAQDFSLVSLSLLYVAQPLLEHGIDVEIIDQRFEKDFFGELRRRLTPAPICIGINCITGPQIDQVISISKFLRGLTDVPLVLGGPHATLFPEQTLQSGLVDYIVMGKGEVPFLNLVQALKNNATPDGIANIGYMRHSEMVIRKGVVPEVQVRTVPYHLVSRYGRPATVPIFTSYGCPYRCAFCVEKVLHPVYHEVPISDVIFMIEDALRLEPNFIDFLDDNFLINHRRVMDIFSLTSRKGLLFSWVCMGRADGVMRMSDEALAFLKQQGLVSIYFGIESGSEKILKLINKRITPEMVLELNLRMKKEGIQPHYSFMAGFPTETEEDILATRNLIRRLKQENPNAVVWKVNQYTPYPGTELFDVAVKNGFKPPEKFEDWSRVYFYSKEYGAAYDAHL
jgi:anaerobic magnesium-protoporphyrin IX monomethyl ester cyclase